MQTTGEGVIAGVHRVRLGYYFITDWQQALQLVKRRR